VGCHWLNIPKMLTLLVWNPLPLDIWHQGPSAKRCDPPVLLLGPPWATSPALLLSVGWKHRLASHRAWSPAWMHRALHGTAASVQQLPPERLPVPKLAEIGNADAWQLHHQWRRQVSSGRQGQGGWGATSGDQGPMPNQTALSYLQPSVSFLWPTLLLTYLPWMFTLATLSKFSPMLTLPPYPTGVTETLTPRSYTFVPGLPILARDSKFHLKVKI
jgi:hypothetical protein